VGVILQEDKEMIFLAYKAVYDWENIEVTSVAGMWISKKALVEVYVLRPDKELDPSGELISQTI